QGAREEVREGQRSRRRPAPLAGRRADRRPTAEATGADLASAEASPVRRRDGARRGPAGGRPAPGPRARRFGRPAARRPAAGEHRPRLAARTERGEAEERAAGTELRREDRLGPASSAAGLAPGPGRGRPRTVAARSARREEAARPGARAEGDRRGVQRGPVA